MDELYEKRIEFFRLNNKVLRNWASYRYPWTIELLRKYKDILDWWAVASNERMIWTYDIVYEFGAELTEVFYGFNFCSNRSLPWNVEFIEEFWYLMDWEILADNPKIKDNPELRERFKRELRDYLDFDESESEGEYFCKQIASSFPQVEKHIECRFLTIKDIEETQDPDWTAISKNHYLPWTKELIERYRDQWNWKELSKNEMVPWDVELMNYFENEIDWPDLSDAKPGRVTISHNGICENTGIAWNKAILDRFAHKMHHGFITYNPRTEWSFEMLITHFSFFQDECLGRWDMIWELVFPTEESEEIIIPLLDEVLAVRGLLPQG